jgi:hypothetical protein
MWYLKCRIVPLIIAATGIVTTGFRKNLESMPRKHSIDSLQQSTIFGTSHIIREVLQSETESLVVGIAVGSGEVPGRKWLQQRQ